MLEVGAKSLQNGRVDLSEFRDKRVTILGFAREGLALARFLHDRGVRVTVSDRQPAEALAGAIAGLEGRPVALHLGGHEDADFTEADFVFVSPGVPKSVRPVRLAAGAGVPLLSETILFFALCRAPIVGITGSSGKTTTTTLTGAMLGRGPRRVHVGGNIGRPLIEQVESIAPEDLVVTELSSFQLEWLRRSPQWAAITNLTPNHLDVHGTMEAYTEAKSHILRHQSPAGVALLNADDPVSQTLMPQVRGALLQFSLEGEVAAGAYLAGDELVLAAPGRRVICAQRELHLRGRHNVANVLAAAALSYAAGASLEDIRAVATTFEGVAHRLEFVGERDGAWYYNDSIATSPERTIAALESFSEPIVLLLGGRDKHLPLDRLVAVARSRCRAVVCFGEAAVLLETAFAAAGPGGPTLRRAGRFAEAVAVASRLARAGDVVLLSPACTSYDEFRDFEERGAAFRALVAEFN
jgi:UDP-N-acetylmuramoylalanine--D-glutamate ligase